MKIEKKNWNNGKRDQEVGAWWLSLLKRLVDGFIAPFPLIVIIGTEIFFSRKMPLFEMDVSETLSWMVSNELCYYWLVWIYILWAFHINSVAN